MGALLKFIHEGKGYFFSAFKNLTLLWKGKTSKETAMSVIMM